MCEHETSGNTKTFDWGLNRRQFVRAGTAAALAGSIAMEGANAATLAEDDVRIKTPDGTMDAFFVHPRSGRHPAVLTWPDIAGLRSAFKVMARRLAAQGYAVLVVNPYYRSAPAPQFADFASFSAEGGFEKVKPWREALSPDAVKRDATAALNWLDARPEVNAGLAAATNGYCMGGPFTVFTAAAVPERIRAAASLHGAGLVKSGDPASPHAMLGETRSAYLFAIARNDDAKSPVDKDMLRAAAAKAGRPAEIEVYPADHGWTVIDSPAYDKVAAERAWTEMSNLFVKATPDRV